MADNEAKYIQNMKQRLRKVYFRYQYWGKQILSVEDSCSYIAKLINSNEPFMLCRLGAEESRTVGRWKKHLMYTDRNIHNIMFNAGVYPNTKENIDEFCKVYSNSLRDADGVFVWGCVDESTLIRKFTHSNTKLMNKAVNNFLLYDHPWTVYLENKKVLIIHPFVDTIKVQYARRNLLFEKDTLPQFASIEYVKAIQTNAGEHVNVLYNTWNETLKAMEKEIEEKDFDIALIAAGAYGLPLASYIKRMGKQAIHLASDLQILFGIRGKRWDGWAEWNRHFNKYWIYPSENETPKNKSSVEGGSYWK